MSAIFTVSGSRGGALRRLGAAALLGALLLRAVVAPGPAAAQATDADGDADGLVASVEAQYGTDPNRYDTDGDGLNDGIEVTYVHTNPLSQDSDGDGSNDGWELSDRTDPWNPDTDGDGASDGYEKFHCCTDPLVPDAAPAAPADPGQVDPGQGERADGDGDGLFDDDEADVYGTDPSVADTDGDGADDGQEVYDGTDPLDPDDF